MSHNLDLIPGAMCLVATVKIDRSATTLMGGGGGGGGQLRLTRFDEKTLQIRTNSRLVIG